MDFTDFIISIIYSAIFIYEFVFEKVYGACGMFYPLFLSGIVSMLTFFVFKSVNKSIIAMILTALVIFIAPMTPYECKIISLVLAVVTIVFSIVLFKSIR